MATPSEILDLAYQRAVENIKILFIEAIPSPKSKNGQFSAIFD
jgi:hypothetical protein